MKVPTLNGVVDLVALQNMIAMILLSDDRLANVPVLPEIKLHMESDLEADVLWTIPRSAFTVGSDGVTVNNQLNSQATGPVGLGLLVEMVGAALKYPDMPGPSLNWEINVVAMEERNINLNPATGTGIMAEQACQIVLDILHVLLIRDYGTIRANDKPIEPAHDWMGMKPGIVAYRASLVSLSARNQTARSASVDIAFAGGMCTITTIGNTPDFIYYTQTPIPQGASSAALNAPAPVKANPNVQVYTGPFAVTSGDAISSSTYTAGLIQSAINTQIAP